MTFTIYHQQLGGHVHMRVFANGGKCGDLCMRENEFTAFRASARFIQFREEGADTNVTAKDPR